MKQNYNKLPRLQINLKANEPSEKNLELVLARCNTDFIKISILNMGIEATRDLIENDMRTKLEEENYIYVAIRKAMLDYIDVNIDDLSKLKTLEDCNLESK